MALTEIEEVRGVKDAARITLSVLFCPRRFGRYADPQRLGEARGYVITGIAFIMAAFLLVKRLNEHEGKIHLEISSSTAWVHAYFYINLNPEALDIDSLILIVGVLAVLAAVGRLFHAVLSRLAQRTVPRHVATITVLYWFGFTILVSAVIIVVGYLLIRGIGPGEHNTLWVAGPLLLFVLVYLYVFGICVFTFFEWPRKAYGVRAFIYYPWLIGALVVLSGVYTTVAAQIHKLTG